jgi:hypothetical protein
MTAWVCHGLWGGYQSPAGCALPILLWLCPACTALIVYCLYCFGCALLVLLWQEKVRTTISNSLLFAQNPVGTAAADVN